MSRKETRSGTGSHPLPGTTFMKIFGLGAGREVGIIKNAIREAILEGDITNTYDDALQFMLLKAKELGLSPVTH